MKTVQPVKNHRTQTGAAPAAAPPSEGRPKRLGREAGEGVLACLLTIAAISWSFPPYELWPLAFVGLVPWGLAVCRAERPWVIHWLGLFGGWGFYLFNLRWMIPVTGLGYAALAFYLALYWPLTTWAVRTARRHGISVIWSLPVVWTACEYLRAWVMSGFPWFFIAHAFYRQPLLIQISDLTGAYGVTFLAVMANGLWIELLLCRRPAHGAQTSKRQLLAGGAAVAALWSGALLYGGYRLRQVDFRPGPRIAVIQHDFPIVATPPYSDPRQVLLSHHLTLAAQAAEQKPDLVAFPESAWNAEQNAGFLEVEYRTASWAFGKLCHEATAAFARGDYAAVNGIIDRLQDEMESYRGGRPTVLPRLPAQGGPPVTVAVGAVAVETFPEAVAPKVKKFNSVLIYDRDGRQQRQRYDKTHLVPFGELVPFRYGRLHWLYRWLNDLSPMSYGGKLEYSLTPGRELEVFKLPTAAGTMRFGTPICYEDVMPYVIRNYVWDNGRRRVDFLVNVSNDGWFLHSPELPQHLASCVFRAVENRVGIARAVNTGISGFIDPNGRLYSMVEKDGRWLGDGEGIIGWRVDRVWLDQRASVYGRFGDWFSQLCLGLTVVVWLTAMGERWGKGVWKRVAARRAKGGAAHESV